MSSSIILVVSLGFSCCLQTVTVLFFLFNLDIFNLCIFVWFLWLGLPILCRIKVAKVGITVLFLIWERVWIFFLNTFCRIIDFSNYVAMFFFFLKKCISGKSHLDHTTGFKIFKKINPFLILISCHDKPLTLGSLIVMKVVTKF